MARESWGSRLGFIFAAVGSAVGLANIVRFPYMVGKNGGAAFILTYLLCLLIIGFPVFITELLIGRTTQRNPSSAFEQLGKNKVWKGMGGLTIFTGFIVSSFYSALAGWILGYLVEAALGNVTNFQTTQGAISFYHGLISSPVWGVGFHGIFMLLCVGILYTGVRKGLERASKIMMPLMFFVLMYLVIMGLSLPNAKDGLKFLLTPDWLAVTPGVFLMALGQSFFTLSLGQGTMITYGSYLPKKCNLITTSIPIVLADTLVSILAAIAVFTIVFSVGMEPDAGLGLIFHTLPVVFSKITGGYWLAVAFFMLVALAAVTSEISAMEPTISYLVDERNWKRQNAVMGCGIGAFLLGIPSALSFSIFNNVTIHGMSILEALDFCATGILLPLGGAFAVILVAWRWGINSAITTLYSGTEAIFKSNLLNIYLKISIKYIAPIAIFVVAVHALMSY